MILVVKNLENNLHTSVVGTLPNQMSNINQGRFFKNFIGKKNWFGWYSNIKEFNTGFESEV